MKLKKGSLEAKRFMAKIRAMKSGTKKKSIGATKFVEKKEPKNTKPKRTIQITRSADGTFKKFKQIGGLKKVYKGYNISRTPTGYYEAYLSSQGKFFVADTLQGIKNAINKDIKSLGATKFVEKKEPKNTKPKRTIQITRKADGTFKKFKQIGSIHKDTKSHNVKINVLSGIKTPSYYDKDMAREISIFADNDVQLYDTSRAPILNNLQNKYNKGIFKVELASKLYVDYIEKALKKYHKMFIKRGSWSKLMTPADRRLLAMEYAQDTLNEFKANL